MGEVFAGRYELVDPIGRGGVGAVWRAWDHRRRRYVAAKVLQQRDAHSLLRFVREQALRIDHPHVLAPASWAADDDKVLFTMDLVGGGSLVHLIGDYGPLPPAFVCTLLDQLLSGLAAVHAEDVVHRDIKPANVLLEATGTGRPHLRLSDFGIAMRMGEPRLTETNLVVGTPGYLAPEQMLGAEPDFPADLFAVGLVALYLLEGAKPDTKALVEYFAAHGTPSAPKGIPEPLWQVVASLLQPDPQARFRTATGARKALAAAAELLPEPGPDDEVIEIFDQLGPLPPGFAADGPLVRAPGVGARPGATFATGEVRKEPASWPGDRDASSEPPGSGAGAKTGTGSASVSPDENAPRSGTASPVGRAPGTGYRPTGSRPDTDPRLSTGPRPEAHTPAPPPEAHTPAPPPSMSDTGSFHLPPPQDTGSSPRTPAPPARPPEPPPYAEHRSPAPQAAPVPPPVRFSPNDPTYVLSAPRPAPPAPQQRADVSTASYTAEVPRIPRPAPEVSGGAGRRDRRAGHRARRPGPPAKVVLPLLLLALACYAVGFWALARI
ncbi:protein kinase [Streptomyces sp. NPDC002766]|uniref:serine/threonine protein kinase n=1 Tax=Streptomyces sp. NPDC002766 TaxID=3154429 RepID=UPI003319121E